MSRPSRPAGARRQALAGQRALMSGGMHRYEAESREKAGGGAHPTYVSRSQAY
jgi:hypothetical protein